MNTLPTLREAFRGKSVLVTGHTGFKGSWLCEVLLSLGAQVHGFSLPLTGENVLFQALGLAGRVNHREGDVYSLHTVQNVIHDSQADFVFHLAAQPLVRESYERPSETFAVNAMGTVHVVEALRKSGKTCVCLCITTDKVYENREWAHAYRETDRLGGRDPYSASKACAEMVVHAYRESFFNCQNGIALASARAGNVIGGGDFAKDRIVPDTMRAVAEGKPVVVRNPHAVRPWQHVLDPLHGYLVLASQMMDAQQNGGNLSVFDTFNFGPERESFVTVEGLLNEMFLHWEGHREMSVGSDGKHEASLLSLSIDKAWHVLRWSPRWNFAQAVQETVYWYRTCMECKMEPQTCKRVTGEQIERFFSY